MDFIIIIIIPIKNKIRRIKKTTIFFKFISFKSNSISLFLLRPKIEYNILFKNIPYYVKYHQNN